MYPLSITIRLLEMEKYVTSLDLNEASSVLANFPEISFTDSVFFENA